MNTFGFGGDWAEVEVETARRQLVTQLAIRMPDRYRRDIAVMVRAPAIDVSKSRSSGAASRPARIDFDKARLPPAARFDLYQDRNPIWQFGGIGTNSRRFAICKLLHPPASQ
jgi:hypothetical protein